MTESGSWRDEVEATVGDEVSLIVEAFARRGIDIEVVPADGGLGYMFARGQLLVRDQYLPRVLEILGQPTERELRDSEPDRLQRITPGVQLVTLGPTPSGEQHLVRDAVSLVNRELGLGIATPDHVLTVAGTAGGCPATEPAGLRRDRTLPLGVPRQRG